MIKRFELFEAVDSEYAKKVAADGIEKLKKDVEEILSDPSFTFYSLINRFEYSQQQIVHEILLATLQSELGTPFHSRFRDTPQWTYGEEKQNAKNRAAIDRTIPGQRGGEVCWSKISMGNDHVFVAISQSGTGNTYKYSIFSLLADEDDLKNFDNRDVLGYSPSGSSSIRILVNKMKSQLKKLIKTRGIRLADELGI